MNCRFGRADGCAFPTRETSRDKRQRSFDVILGFGIDLLENGRVERELACGPWRPADGVFTPREILECNSARKPALRYAACFAAKEAVLKALGREVADLASLREVEVEHQPGRDYSIVLHDRLRAESEQLGVRRIWLSVAQQAAQTAAMVILET
jgi:holo-[acyl-carrier protein] synthase